MIVLGLAISALLILFAPGIVSKVAVRSEAGQTLLIYAVIFLPMAATGLAFARIEEFSALRVGDAPGRWAGIGMGAGMFGLAMTALLSAIAGSLVPGQAASAGAAGLLAGTGLILFQTGSEELFFRGWLLRAIEGRTNPVVALILSAVLFTVFHILGGSRAAMTLLNLFLGGVWFGLLAWRSGGLVAPLLAHFGWNATEELIAGLSPNPGIGSFGALHDWDLFGSPFWGGSEEGLNTSVGMSIVLVALIVPLAWRSGVRSSAIAPAAPAPHRPGPAAG